MKPIEIRSARFVLVVDEQQITFDPELLTADGFDAAIIGVASRCGMQPVVVYDRAKCLEILMANDDMDYETAEEFFEFNVAGAYVGERTPMYLMPVADLDATDDDSATG